MPNFSHAYENLSSLPIFPFLNDICEIYKNGYSLLCDDDLICDISGFFVIEEEKAAEPVEESKVLDLDGDGKADAVTVDLDHDGKIDAVAIDTDDDGKADKLIVDTDGDGVADTILTE